MPTERDKEKTCDFKISLVFHGASLCFELLQADGNFHVASRQDGTVVARQGAIHSILAERHYITYCKL